MIKPENQTIWPYFIKPFGCILSRHLASISFPRFYAGGCKGPRRRLRGQSQAATWPFAAVCIFGRSFLTFFLFFCI